jgi:hypothetical protein
MTRMHPFIHLRALLLGAAALTFNLVTPVQAHAGKGPCTTQNQPCWTCSCDSQCFCVCTQIC